MLCHKKSKKRFQRHNATRYSARYPVTHSEKCGKIKCDGCLTLLRIRVRAPMDGVCADNPCRIAMAAYETPVEPLPGGEIIPRRDERDRIARRARRLFVFQNGWTGLPTVRRKEGCVAAGGGEDEGAMMTRLILS